MSTQYPNMEDPRIDSEHLHDYYYQIKDLTASAKDAMGETTTTPTLDDLLDASPEVVALFKKELLISKLLSLAAKPENNHDKLTRNRLYSGLLHEAADIKFDRLKTIAFIKAGHSADFTKLPNVGTLQESLLAAPQYAQAMDTCVGDIIKCATERNNTTASIQGMDAEGYDVSKYAYIVGMIVNDAVNHYLNNSSGDLNQETIQRLFDQLMEAQQKFNGRIPDMVQNNGGQLFESDFIDKELDTPNM